jgi:hypothetical protein
MILPGLVLGDVASFWASGGGPGALAETAFCSRYGESRGALTRPLFWGRACRAWLIVDPGQ